MLSLAGLVKVMKGFACNSSVSDEDFLNDFLETLIFAGKINNKNNEQFYLSKSRTCEIMNGKIDVPRKLREAVLREGITDIVVEGMRTFINDSLDSNRENDMKNELSSLVKREYATNKTEQENVLKNEADLALFLTDLLFKALAENNVAKADTVTICKHGVYSAEVRTGDIFRFGFDNRKKTKNIVVIPVNTAFDSHVSRKIEGTEYQLVSVNTLHGQWLVRMTASGEDLEQIDVRIAESLARTGFAPSKKANTENGKQHCYPIGATAIIETRNAVYFLLAISEFDCFNNARSSVENIRKALVSLIDIYDRFGQGYDLYLPLMGTGLSRTGLTLQAAYDMFNEVVTSCEGHIHGNIHLVLRAQDRKEIMIKGI